MFYSRASEALFLFIRLLLDSYVAFGPSPQKRLSEEQLKDLKSKKKSIEAAIKEEKLSKLLAAIEEKGITVEDAIAKLCE